MQTQWSTPANDGLGGAPDAVAPAPPEGAGTVRETVEAVEPVEPVEPVDGIGPVGPVDGIGPGAGAVDDGVSAALADDGIEPGEEEAHRSAVDAVDALLDEVELALARLDDGTYGRCEECGTPIGDARLAESPTVRTCGTCVIGGGGDSVPAVTAPRAPGGPTGPIGPVGAHRE